MENIYVPQPASQQSPGNQPPSGVKKTPHFPVKVLVILLLLCFLGLNVIAVVLNYFNILDLSQRSPQYLSWLPRIPKLEDALINNVDAVYLPIPLSDNSIHEFSLKYIMDGVVKEVKPIDTGAEISLMARASYFPRFTISTSARILSGNPLLENPKLTDIKTGDKVRIEAEFNYANKQWKVIRVVITK
jgi:hypothetical protein